MPPSTPSLITRIQHALHGLAELCAFVGAGACAIGQLFLGRWPEPSRMRARSNIAERKKVEKIGPYPIND
jgi:hypothetical protein